MGDANAKARKEEMYRHTTEDKSKHKDSNDNSKRHRICEENQVKN